jgi:propionyl-CoA synthetase
MLLRIDSAQVRNFFKSSSRLHLFTDNALFLIRRNRTSHPLAPFRRRSLRSRHPRLPKGHLPFAFVQPTSTAGSSGDKIPATPPAQLFKEVNGLVREQIGAIAALGGMIQGRGMIPKTRSGKTPRCLRELVENGVQGKYDEKVSVPATVEDTTVVEVARGVVKEYFEEDKGKGKEMKAKL